MVRREDVFINVPFDDHFQPLFLALVTGIVAHGGTPRCVIELPADKNRLARLTKLIRNSGSSFHDLSRINRTLGKLLSLSMKDGRGAGCIVTHAGSPVVRSGFRE